MSQERQGPKGQAKPIGPVADGWAAQIQTPAEPEQREQQQPDPRAPPAGPGPSPPAEEQTYAKRVWTAYRALCEEMQTPDVPIHALHRRVGGDIRDLHKFLQAECREQRAVLSTGEPTVVGQAALQSGLHLPGGKEPFLNIKLLNPPTVNQPQQPQQPRQVASLNRDDLDVIIEALEYRCEAIETGTDFDEVARLKGIVPTLEKLRAIEAQPQRPEHERYADLLRATARLRYPERTPELEARIEATIARKVQEFTQERQLREYEQSLRRTVAERHPNLSPEERQHYERRVQELVSERRQQMAWQPTTPARSPQQEQSRGLSQSL
jgi:hypothetical protein